MRIRIPQHHQTYLLLILLELDNLVYHINLKKKVIDEKKNKNVQKNW